jgi:hypothetical protein
LNLYPDLTCGLLVSLEVLHQVSEIQNVYEDSMCSDRKLRTWFCQASRIIAYLIKFRVGLHDYCPRSKVLGVQNYFDGPYFRKSHDWTSLEFVFLFIILKNSVEIIKDLVEMWCHTSITSIFYMQMCLMWLPIINKHQLLRGM